MQKKAFLLAMCLCLSLAFFGCGAKPAPERVHITLMHGWGGSGADHAAMRQIYEDFETDNPDIALTYDMVPDSSVLISKAENMLAADGMPDIVSTNGHTSFVQSAQKKGIALDLAPYIAADAAFSANISNRMRSAWTNTDGSIYTLSDAQENIGYWYNEDIFRQAGVTDTGTPQGTVTPPKTWDDFWQACDAIDAISAGTGTLPMMMQLDQVRVLLGARLAASDGASRAFMQRTAAHCAPADVRDAVTDLARAAAYYTGDPLSVGDARQMFFDGKSAIYFNGVWANIAQGKTSTQQNIKYAAFPSNTGAHVAYISPSSGYVVSNRLTSAQTDACIRFIKYMVSEPVQKRIVSETLQAPSNPKISTGWIASKAPILGQAIAVCYEADVEILSLYTVLDSRDSATLDAYLMRLLQGDNVTDAVTALLTGGEPLPVDVASTAVSSILTDSNIVA